MQPYATDNVSLGSVEKPYPSSGQPLSEIMPPFDNKKPVVVFLSLLMLTVGLSGCTGLFGGDTEPEPEPEPELADWDVYYVDSGSDLPVCGSPTLGRLYYVASTAGFETCRGNAALY